MRPREPTDHRRACPTCETSIWRARPAAAPSRVASERQRGRWGSWTTRPAARQLARVHLVAPLPRRPCAAVGPWGDPAARLHSLIALELLAPGSPATRRRAPRRDDLALGVSRSPSPRRSRPPKIETIVTTPRRLGLVELLGVERRPPAEFSMHLDARRGFGPGAAECAAAGGDDGRNASPGEPPHDGQHQGEGRLARPGAHGQATLHALGQLARDREPEPRALRLLVGSEERLEDVRHVLAVDPQARGRRPRARTCPFARAAETRSPVPGGRVAQRVVEQDPQHLGDALGVAVELDRLAAAGRSCDVRAVAARRGVNSAATSRAS